MNAKSLLIISMLLAFMFICGTAAADDAAFPTMPRNTIAGTLAGTTLDIAGTYKLADDVQLTDSNLTISGGTEANPVILDLNGYTLFGTEGSSVITVEKDAYFTLTDSAMQNSRKLAKLFGTSSQGVISRGEGTIIAYKNYGGALWNEGNTKIFGGTFSGNTADFGGAIYNNGGDLTIFNAVFTGNAAETSGGAIYLASGKVQLQGGKFTGNTAEKYGGAVYIEKGELTVFKGSFTENTAGWRGGAIYIGERGICYLRGGTAENNYADVGGAVYAANGSTYHNFGGWIEDNETNKKYTDIYSSSENQRMDVEKDDQDKTREDFAKDRNYSVTNPGEKTPEKNIYHKNTETYYKTLRDAYNAVLSGGTITVLADVEEKTPVTIKKDVTLNLNGKTISYTATSTDFIIVDDAKFTILDTNGGVIERTAKSAIQHIIYINDGSVEMYGGMLTGSEATRDDSNGAAVYLNDGSFTLIKGTITGNTCENGGGAVFINKGTFLMYGGEISGNSASYGGGVCVFDKDGRFTMYGGTLSGNIAKYGSEIAVFNGKYTLSGSKLTENEETVWTSDRK